MLTDRFNTIDFCDVCLIFQPAILNLMIPASVFGQDVENLRGILQDPIATSCLKHRYCGTLPKSAAISAFVRPLSTRLLRRVISMPVHFTQEFVLFTCRCPSLIAQVTMVVDDAVEVVSDGEAELLRCVVAPHFDVKVILEFV